VSNRVIKESHCSSEKISSLTDFEFRLWVGLITQVDDAGRGDARPAIIKGRVFPLRERVSIKDIESALHGLAAKGCVSLYSVGGKPYFWFPTWSKHQRIRDCKPKYPAPDCGEQFAEIEDCGGLPQVAADCGLNPIQSESNPNPYPNLNPKDGADKPPRFLPPSEDDVRKYCEEMGYQIDPVGFVEFYASKGWMVGKNKMKDWKAAVRNWESRRKTGGSKGGNVFMDMLREEQHGTN